MLEERAANQVETIVRIDERLTDRRIAVERSNVELRARDRQIERRAVLRDERDIDNSRQPIDLVARDTIRAWLGGERLDVVGDKLVDKLRGGRREEDVGRARVEDDRARLLQENVRPAVDGDLRRRNVPKWSTPSLVSVDKIACRVTSVSIRSV